MIEVLYAQAPAKLARYADGEPIIRWRCTGSEWVNSLGVREGLIPSGGQDRASVLRLKIRPHT